MTEGGICQAANSRTPHNYSSWNVSKEMCQGFCDDISTCVAYSHYTQNRCALWIDTDFNSMPDLPSGEPYNVTGWPGDEKKFVGANWVAGHEITKGSGDAGWQCLKKQT
eukprot:UN05336